MLIYYTKVILCFLNNSLLSNLESSSLNQDRSKELQFLVNMDFIFIQI